MPSTKNFGKQFEQRVYEDFKRCYPEGLILRMHDQMSGFKTVSKNLCDYISYVKPIFYALEIKSVQTPSFPFTNLHQYDQMEAVCNIEGVKPLVIIWFVEKDLILAVPIQTIRKMKKDGLKSLNPTKLDTNKYYMMNVPSVKLRTFMKSDYRCLDDLPTNEELEKYGE